MLAFYMIHHHSRPLCCCPWFCNNHTSVFSYYTFVCYDLP